MVHEGVKAAQSVILPAEWYAGPDDCGQPTVSMGSAREGAVPPDKLRRRTRSGSNTRPGSRSVLSRGRHRTCSQQQGRQKQRQACVADSNHHASPIRESSVRRVLARFPNRTLEANSLDLVLGQPFLRAVVELGGAWALVRSHLLGVLERTAIGEIGGDPGRPECMA